MSLPNVSLSFNVGSIAEVRRGLEKYRKEYGQAFYEGLFFLGQQVRDEARNNLDKQEAVDTGALKASIYVTRQPSKSAIKEQTVSPQSVRSYKASALRASIKSHSPGIKSGRSWNLNAGSINSNMNFGAKRIQVTDNATMNQFSHEKTDLFRQSRGSLEEVEGKNSFSSVAIAGYDQFYIAVGASVRYAVFVEFGTEKMRARPFLRPAMGLFDLDGLETEIKKVLARKGIV